MKDEDDRQVASDDQKRQQDDHHRLEDADVHRTVVAKSQWAGGTLGHIHEATAQVQDPPFRPPGFIHGFESREPAALATASRCPAQHL